jgi:hypothetical protein
MPLRREGTSHLIRILRGRAERLAMRTELAIRFDYGSIIPWVTREGDHSLQAVAGPDMVVLRSDVPLRPDGLKHHADFMVTARGGSDICARLCADSGREGAFFACSFWYADNLILLGRRREASELFERLLSLCNDVGLLAEEYVPTRRMVGNFAQAFSHVTLINTAHNLARAEKPAEQRSSSTREPIEQA